MKDFLRRNFPQELKSVIRHLFLRYNMQTCIKRLPKKLTFVQVGSNDGVQGDPLHKHIVKNEKWVGLLIEPIPFLYERLKKNYDGRSNLKFLNCAINNSLNSCKIFYISESAAESLDLPYWYDQLGSFSIEHILKHCRELGVSRSQIEPFIESHMAPCMTLMKALSLNGIGSVDLIHIDTEGYDLEIIKQINFKNILPQMIIYETVHLSQSDEVESSEILRENGYFCKSFGNDTIALSERHHRRLFNWL